MGILLKSMVAFKLTLALLVALAASNELESLDNSNNQAMSSVGMFGGATASGTSTCAFDAGERKLGDSMSTNIEDPIAFAEKLVGDVLPKKKAEKGFLLDDGDGTLCIHSVAGAASTLSDSDAQDALNEMLGTMRTKLCDGADLGCCSSGTACEVTFCMSGFDLKNEKEIIGGEIQVADGDGGYNTLNIFKLGIATKKAVACIVNNDGSKCMSGSKTDTFSMQMKDSDDPTDEDKERIIAMFASAA